MRRPCRGVVDERIRYCFHPHEFIVRVRHLSLADGDLRMRAKGREDRKREGVQLFHGEGYVKGTN